MNSNEKKWIVLLVAVVVIAVVLFVVLGMGNKEEGQVQQGEQEEMVNEEKYVTELNDGTKVNTSEDLKQVKRYNDLEISNIQYTSKDGKTVLLADVKNVGSTTHEPEIVRLTVLGENGEVITEAKPAIERIEPGETKQINASISADVANAKDIRIEAVD